MIRKTKVHKYNYGRKQEPIVVAPSDEDKVKKLKMFGPGIVISIPLSRWPEYQATYKLDPSGRLEPKEERKYGPGEAILLVKRRYEEDLTEKGSKE